MIVEVRVSQRISRGTKIALIFVISLLFIDFSDSYTKIVSNKVVNDMEKVPKLRMCRCRNIFNLIVDDL